MRKLMPISKTIVEALGQQKAMVVATIVSHQGSTPRTAGTKMVIFPEGDSVGTIGGGRLESQVMERARQVLTEGRAAFMSFDLTSADVGALDMICGGHLEVFLDLLQPDQTTVEVFQAWHEAISNGRIGFLVTAVSRDGQVPSEVTHGLIDASGAMTGKIPIPTEARAAILEEARGYGLVQVKTWQDTTLIVEPTITTTTAYIVGAGHVSMPTAHLAAMTGFRVVVVDDRREFANQERFPEAAVIRVTPDYDHCLEEFPLDEDSFVVIVTRGHLHDKITLTQALKSRAGYIGMIGSRRKRNAIYQVLLEEGFTNKDLERVHSPIGLSINAETPEEIAVSIVAEMIQVRAAQKRAATTFEHRGP